MHPIGFLIKLWHHICKLFSSKFFKKRLLLYYLSIENLFIHLLKVLFHFCIYLEKVQRLWRKNAHCLVYLLLKEVVQGTGDSDSTCLYSAIAKPNMSIKTKKLSIIWHYLALICKAEMPYLPAPLYLYRKFFITFFLLLLFI